MMLCSRKAVNYSTIHLLHPSYENCYESDVRERGRKRGAQRGTGERNRELVSGIFSCLMVLWLRQYD